MATKNKVPSNQSYSSRVKKTYQLNNDDLLAFSLEKSVTFVAGTTGAVASHDLLSITGVVALSIIGVCGTNLAGATATIEVGTATTTDGLLPTTTGTDLIANEIWHDASPDASIELTSVILKKIVTADVAYKISTAALSAGEITFYIRWSPISEDGAVALA